MNTVIKRVYDKDKPEQDGWCDPHDKKELIYCIESPKEVVQTLATNYRIAKYLDYRDPFGKTKYNPAIEINQTQGPIGCTVTKKLEELVHLLDDPYELSILSWQVPSRKEYRYSNRELDGAEQITTAELKKRFNKELYRNNAKNNLRWVENDRDFISAYQNAIHFLVDNLKQKNKWELTNIVYEIIPKCWKKENTLKYVEEEFFINSFFAEMHEKIKRKAKREMKLDPALLDQALENAKNEFNNRYFPPAMLEMVEIYDGIINPTYHDIRKLMFKFKKSKEFEKED